MGVEFTEEQLRVINTHGRNLLVAAAAGSGKTAVLVERIIRMILDDTRPLDIDRLLVVTFTEAAAKEMRERIGMAIEGKLAQDPENAHLERQAALLYKAQISTIHSFCLNVIRNNFNEIGLDPSFRVADETELKLMQQELLNSYFERLYDEKDEEFLNLVEEYCRGVNDNALKDAVLKLYEASMGNPWPEEWLDDSIKTYKISSVTELKNTPWLQFAMKYIHMQIEEAILKIKQAIDIANMPYGPSQYTDVLMMDLANLETMNSIDDIEKLVLAINDLDFKRIPTVKGDVDDELKDQAKTLRDSVKDILISSSKPNSLKNLFSIGLDDEIRTLNKLSVSTAKLVDMTKSFSLLYEEQRRSKGIISFSDMEHYALNILYDTDASGNHVPSAVAHELKDSFDEILMDEYQDCNRVQELLMDSISNKEPSLHNRFMVGDVKQSIYKFRLADPKLFIEKYERYRTHDQIGQDESDEERIDLHKNFRSRESVVNSVNNLFGQIMHRDFGGVEYDDDARLVLGASFPEPEGENLGDENETEYLLLELNNDSDEKRGVQEARLIANRINHLVGHHMVTDKETGKLRPATYKDIVILLRSMTDVADGLKTVLNEEGIPVFMSLSSGFYDTREIQMVIQLLKVIDNPRQDIPLYGAMTSFFGGFNPSEVASIRAFGPSDDENMCLYDRLAMILNSSDSSEFPTDMLDKLKGFIDFIHELRQMTAYTSIHELISYIVTSSGYMDYVTALRGGQQRRANVNMLIAKAAAFENTSYRGLFHFLRYIKELRKIQVDDGEADISDENADVVRIMTIHKSKGLEFPICFLSGIHKQFNTMDMSGNLVIDSELGLGATYVDTKKRIKYNPLFRRILNIKMRQDMVGEELRVLYVALTRAKEKLIVTGVIKDREDFLKRADEAKANAKALGRVSGAELNGAKSYMDLMLPVLAEGEIIPYDAICGDSVDEAVELLDRRGAFLKAVDAVEEAKIEELRQHFERSYPHEELRNLITKTSVSELKKAYIDMEMTKELFPETDEKKSYEPHFIVGDTDELKGTERGNAYHKSMEILDFNDRNIKSQLNKAAGLKLIPEKWIAAVREDRILKFLDSELGIRMAKAQQNGTLKREQPFVMGIDAHRVNEEYPAGEMVLLQGIIDAFFIEDGQIVLVDYKTDVINFPEELMERYHVQLDYYEEALSNILKLPVKESILYSFHLGCEIHRNAKL